MIAPAVTFVLVAAGLVLLVALRDLYLREGVCLACGGRGGHRHGCPRE